MCKDNRPFINAELEYEHIEKCAITEFTTTQYDLCYIAQGRCVIDVDGERRVIGEKSLYLLERGTHRVEKYTGLYGVFEQVVIHIDSESICRPVTSCEREQERFIHAILMGVVANMTISELAEMCCLSVSTFKRRFKNYSDEPPHVWLLGCRLDLAFRIATTIGIATSDLASMCGFISTSHFIATFKRRFGITPSRLCRRRYSQYVSDIISASTMPSMM